MTRAHDVELNAIGVLGSKRKVVFDGRNGKRNFRFASIVENYAAASKESPAGRGTAIEAEKSSQSFLVC